MVELERAILPSLSDKIKRYIDNTIAFVKTDVIKTVLSSLDSDHGNIQFPMKSEQYKVIPISDVLLIYNVETISTTIYSKVTNTDIYINWKSFALSNWKCGTLKTLGIHIPRDYYLRCDLQTIEELNDYPILVINKVFKELQRKQHETTLTASDNKE